MVPSAKVIEKAAELLLKEVSTDVKLAQVRELTEYLKSAEFQNITRFTTAGLLEAGYLLGLQTAQTLGEMLGWLPSATQTVSLSGTAHPAAGVKHGGT